MMHRREQIEQEREGGAAARPQLSVPIRPRRVTRALAAVVASLVVLSVASHLAQHLLPDFPGRDWVASMSDLDGEWNLPALYSALVMLICSAVLWVIARVEQLGSSRSAHGWRLLSVLFVGLALDELLGLHEALNDYLELGALARATGFAWVSVGAAFVVAVALAFSRFLARLPAATRRGFLLAGAMFLGGSLGVEVIGGHLARTLGQESLSYLATAYTEEILEMTGIILFLQALLAHLHQCASAIILDTAIDPKVGDW